MLTRFMTRTVFQGVLAFSLLLTVPACARAGQEPDAEAQNGPAVAMGSGRMVRGTVASVAPGKLTIKTESGDTWTAALSANTRVLKGRESVKASDAHVGDGVGAMGEVDQPSKTVHALFVSLVDAEQVKKMRDSLGRTWIVGKVTAIDELRLTILRSDKVSQVIAVDEDTSFKRGGRGMSMAMQGGDVSGPLGGGAGGFDGAGGGQGGRRGGDPGNAGSHAGESITLADVKVGDNIAGQGALKNGIFVPKELAVADPAQRRRRPGAPGAGMGSSSQISPTLPITPTNPEPKR